MSEKHYNIEEALEKQGGVFNQTYDLKIVKVGETKNVNTGAGPKKVQALQVSDGTAEIKWSVWEPDRIFTEGMGVHLEKVYIVEKDGYTDLKVAKAGADLIKFSDSSDVKIQPKKTHPIPAPKEDNKTFLLMMQSFNGMWGTLKEILDLLEEKKGD